jgi:tRNA (guanine37-N1)-methyltransferase
MKISIITLFPEVFEPILNSSILKRAQKKGLVEFELINLRPFGEGAHQVVDDRPYGGGVGLVFKADILAKAVNSLRPPSSNPQPKTILTSASGTPYTQQKAKELSQTDHIIIVCGHYEGVDQRFIEKYVDEEISVGDYVLTGGEIPAMILADSITRLIPGVLEKPEATELESFSIFDGDKKLLEYPHYTRPEVFEGEKVPAVLISGHHGEVDKWRQEKAIEKTKKVRPDLLDH